MFAIAFDLRVTDTEQNHPKGISQAYRDIYLTLEKFQFRGIQGSVYVTDVDDMANVLSAMLALKALPWFRHPCGMSVRFGLSCGLTSLL